MGLMDDLANVQSSELAGSGARFVDADTLTNDTTGENYRLLGYNAGEVDKIIDGKLSSGTAGGQASAEVINRLANEQGFSNIRPQLDDNGNPVRDKYGRILADLEDADGRSFQKELAKAGSFDITRFDSEENIIARDLAEAKRRNQVNDGTRVSTSFEEGARIIQNAEAQDGQYSRGLKTIAYNEAERWNIIQQKMNDGYTQQEAENELRGYVDLNQTQVETFGVNKDNQALSPFSDSLDQGWKNVELGAYGVMEMLGQKTGWEGIEAIGEQGQARVETELTNYGRTVLDYKEVDGFGTAIQYLGNNLALSLPQMGVTALATVGAGVGGIVTAPLLAAPAALYAGQVWNEMEGENKSASWAIGAGIAQGTLDVLGLKFASKGLGGDQILKKAVGELVKKGNTKAGAEAIVANASRQQIAEFTGAAAEHAKQQIAAKQLGKNMTKALLQGGAGEAGTEALQETIGYTAATMGSDKEWSWDEYNNRIISAAIAGGSLGGALSTASTIKDAGAWADVAYRLEPQREKHRNQADLYVEQEEARTGRPIVSTHELAADAGRRAAAAPGVNIKDRTLNEDARKEATSLYDKVAEFATNPQQLWQGSMRNLLTDDIRSAYPAAEKIMAVFGGGLNRTHHGAAMENQRHHQTTIAKNMVGDPQQFYQSATGKGHISRSERNSLSDQFYETTQKAVNKDGVFDPNLIPDNHPKKAIFLKQVKDMQRMADYMYDIQAKYNPELGREKNYLLTYKGIDKSAIHKNAKGFKEALMKNGYSAKEANDFFEEVRDNPEVNSIEDFSVVKGGFKPGSHQARSLNMAQKAEFKDFMEKDMYANMSSAAKSAARFATQQEFVGKDGAVVSQMLNDLEAEGMPSAEVDKIAAGLQNILDAESGNYKRPTSAAGKKLAAYQKNFMMFSTLSALPLATISSLVETMLISKGLTADQIFGKKNKGSLQHIGEEAARTMWAGAKEIGTAGYGKQIKDNDRTKLARELGYYDWDVGAATTTGVSEVHPWQQYAYEKFFKVTGLTGYTNFTRAARASIGGDYINDKLEIAFQASMSIDPRTNGQREAIEQLRNLGLDVEGMLPIYKQITASQPLDPEQEAFYESQMREALFSFTNDAIVLPQATNRPLIYQDPRFALFTQFQGFIATFTANQIPKMWDEYVKRGSPAMKYNAFALAVTMIGMGFVSQHLKDLLKYGESTPHLEGADYFQRGVRASGLLGTSERIIDQFAPLYESNSRGEAEWAWNTVSGESAALGYAGKLAGAAGSLLEGDVEQATYAGLRAAPIFGPLTSTDKWFATGITGGGWNFKGDN